MFNGNEGFMGFVFFFIILVLLAAVGSKLITGAQSRMNRGKPSRELVEIVINRHNVYEEGDEVMLCGEKLESVGSVVPVKSLFYIRLKDGTTYLTGNANVVVRSRQTQAED